MPLVLDLLRHGAALPAGRDGDEARVLSARGRRDLERLAAHLAAMGWRPDRAFSSPLARARESAEIVLERAAPGIRAGLAPALRPDADLAAALELVAAEEAIGGQALLVGHQPLLGLLAASLTAGPAPPFAPGSLVRIARTGSGSGQLGWRLDPDSRP